MHLLDCFLDCPNVLLEAFLLLQLYLMLVLDFFFFGPGCPALFLQNLVLFGEFFQLAFVVGVFRHDRNDLGVEILLLSLVFFHEFPLIGQRNVEPIVFLQSYLILLVGLLTRLFSEVQHHFHVGPFNFPLLLLGLHLLELVSLKLDLVVQFGDCFGQSHDFLPGSLQVFCFSLGLVAEVVELFSQVQNHFLILGDAVDHQKVFLSLIPELLCLLNQLVVDLLVLITQFSVESVDLIDLGFKLKAEVDFFAEGLLGGVIFVHQDCLFIAETEVVLPQLPDLLKDLAVLLLVQLIVHFDDELFLFQFSGEFYQFGRMFSLDVTDHCFQVAVGTILEHSGVNLPDYLSQLPIPVGQFLHQRIEAHSEHKKPSIQAEHICWLQALRNQRILVNSQFLQRRIGSAPVEVLVRKRLNANPIQPRLQALLPHSGSQSALLFQQTPLPIATPSLFSQSETLRRFAQQEHTFGEESFRRGKT